MKNIVFMFSRQRSGTNALNSILNKHNDVLCTWEIFTDDKNLNYNFWSYVNKSNISFYYYRMHPIEIFDNFIKYISNSTNKNIIVIDVKYNGINSINYIWFSSFFDTPDIIKYIYKNKYNILQLTRYNLLDQYISIIRADFTKQYTFYDNSEEKYFSFNLDINKFKKFIKSAKKEDAYFKKLFHKCNNYLTLDYNELFTNNFLSEYAINKLQKFLNIDNLKNIKSDVKKIIKDKSKIINNYNEVIKFCKDNNLEYY